MSELNEAHRAPTDTDPATPITPYAGAALGWAWAAQPAPEQLVRQFEGAIAAWDRHVASCRDCLNQGRWFCPDGESLTTRVIESRDRLGPRRRDRRTVTMSLALGRSLTWKLTAQLP
jgi:hypothetical protein